VDRTRGAGEMILCSSYCVVTKFGSMRKDYHRGLEIILSRSQFVDKEEAGVCRMCQRITGEIGDHWEKSKYL
jgi:hypothetical protein